MIHPDNRPSLLPTLSLALQNTPLPSDSLEHILEDLFSQVNSQQQQPGASSSPACVSTAGTEVMPARVSTAPGPMQLHFSGNTPRAAVATAAQEAAQKAAMLNADVGRAEHYAGDQVRCCTGMSTTPPPSSTHVHVHIP